MSRPVVIVTGGARGIGRAIAEALIRDGHDVAIVDLAPADEGARVCVEIAVDGARAIYRQADIAEISKHEVLVTSIVAELGGIDRLVNNAGIGAVVRGDLLELKPENFDKVLGVNLRGTVFLTNAVIRAMQGKPSTHARAIVTVTSASAALASPERLDYCISKAGLSMWCQGLALRLAQEGIAAFEVRPGIIRSDMTAAVTAKYDRLIADGLVPAGRWGEPADVAGVVAALLLGPFAFATGSIIDVDGALSVSRL